MTLRIYELARELDLPSREVIRQLREMGAVPRSATSTVPNSLALKVRQHYLGRPENDNPASAPFRPVQTTPATILTWQANPVKEPTQADVIRNVRHLEDTFSEARKHRAMLRELGSQFVFSSTFYASDKEQCGLALARFSGAIESAFGFTREVVFFYSPYYDLQIRTFMLAKQKLAALKREVTPDIIFFSSPDDRLTIKLKDWSSLQFNAIPLPASLSSEPIALIRQLRDFIYARDLFYETTPVSGEKFFGRGTLLQELRDDISHQRVSGLFGLRKSGKTSILLQLAATLSSPKLIPVFVDLETLPSPPMDPTPDFIREIATRISTELSSRRVSTAEFAPLMGQPSISAFKVALDSTVRRLASRGITLVLLLDEIEFLTPSDQVDTEEGPLPGVAQTLASLRAIAQSSHNFTFILSGLTSHILENGRLYGRPNPLFSWAKARYVGPFTRREADELATALGSRMGIEIEEGALEALHDASGGHAYLYRNLASEVVSTLPMDVYRRIMKTSDVLRSLQPWRRAVSGNIEEIVSHLVRYYPIEGILLSTLQNSPEDFAELARDNDRAVHHLVSLGLIHETAGTFSTSVLLELQ